MNRNKHTKKCLPSSVQLDLLWGRDWSLHSTINEFLKRETKGLQEITFNKLTKNTPYFLPFSQSHKWTRHSMIFTHPRCLNCFPTQENLSRKLYWKTLNHKVASFDFRSFSMLKLFLKNELWSLYSAMKLSKSCHDW